MTQFPESSHILIQSCHRRVLTPEVSGCPIGEAFPRTCIPRPPAATRRTATARGGAERNPGSPHTMIPRPNGANGDHTHPVPCALSGHGASCVAWSPGLHPGLSPVAPSGHGHGARRPSHGVASSQKHPLWAACQANPSTETAAFKSHPRPCLGRIRSQTPPQPASVSPPEKQPPGHERRKERLQPRQPSPRVQDVQLYPDCGP